MSGADATPAVLKLALGRYPHTRALLEGEATSPLLRFDVAPVTPVNRAFAPMAREGAFDVCEMAIATFLQARAHGKPLVLLPVVMAARYQEPALLCRRDGAIGRPEDLAGARVGVRSYSQTTALWLRGTLAERHGVRADQMRWITTEGAHVAEAGDPPFVARAPAGADLFAMLRAGELDAVIAGLEPPDDPALRTVFPDPQAAARAFHAAHGFAPVNHLVTAHRDLAEARPDLVVEIVRLLRAAAALTQGGATNAPTRRADLAPALELAARYAAEQGLTPRRLDLADLWAGTPPGVD